MLGWPFWVIAWFDLLTGYVASMALGFLSAQGRGYRHLFKDVPMMPLYWLMISAAAYRALWPVGARQPTDLRAGQWPMHTP
jgi:hypothetical protein